MVEIRTAHTADLDHTTRAVVRALLDEEFDGDFSDDDWDHTVGGMHALVWEDGMLVAHGSVVQRRLLSGGRALRTGYVEGVGVRADRRGRGCGAAVMGALERVIRGGYAVGALSTTEQAVAFYTARGWWRWQGPTWTLTPDGAMRTADDDDAVFVLPVTVTPDPTAALTCDWRDGDVW